MAAHPTWKGFFKLSLVTFPVKAYTVVSESPDGPVGQTPYGVIVHTMTEEKRYAIAQVVMHGRQHTVLLRPMDNVLSMSMLNYENQVTKPSAFEDQAPSAEPSSEELDMAKRLIEVSTTKKFDFAAYTDVYTEKLTKLIEAKVGGEEIVAPPVHEQAQIINLMDALRASLASAGQEQPSEEKPAKKMAPSRAKETRARKKKTS